MPSQAADAESTEAYIASGSSSDHLENREIYRRESKDDRSNKAKKETNVNQGVKWTKPSTSNKGREKNTSR